MSVNACVCRKSPVSAEKHQNLEIENAQKIEIVVCRASYRKVFLGIFLKSSFSTDTPVRANHPNSARFGVIIFQESQEVVYVRQPTAHSVSRFRVDRRFSSLFSSHACPIAKGMVPCWRQAYSV